MPTVRTPLKRAGIKGKITPEAVALYRQLREIEHEDLRRELRHKLNQLLGRSEPWLSSIFWTYGPCTHSPGTAAYNDWPTALALRQALDEAAGYDD